MNVLLLTVALCNTEPMTLDSYNAQHDSVHNCIHKGYDSVHKGIEPLTQGQKSCLTSDIINQIDNEIEGLFQLAFYAYQERDFDSMIEIFDMIDKHERLRQITILNLGK